ncbi:MAG: hydrogenase maturation nickel metallochaperone HypA, partial [Lachnospiraceae bacterium]|nr:hydrogenase maturation nickel metallochaperone HypA [Lachnospiraceae bacterium]
MHELSIVKRFMNIALSSLENEPDVRVRQLILDVGEMSGTEPEYLQKYYESCVRGTQLEGSTLVIRPVPMKVQCQSCGTIYNPKLTPERLCPTCKSG